MWIRKLSGIVLPRPTCLALENFRMNTMAADPDSKLEAALRRRAKAQQEAEAAARARADEQKQREQRRAAAAAKLQEILPEMIAVVHEIDEKLAASDLRLNFDHRRGETAALASITITAHAGKNPQAGMLPIVGTLSLNVSGLGLVQVLPGSKIIAVNFTVFDFERSKFKALLIDFIDSIA